MERLNSISIGQIFKYIFMCLIFCSVIINCTTYHQIDRKNYEKEYFEQHPKGSPGWMKTERILAELDSPQKVADWLCKNYWDYDYNHRSRDYRILQGRNQLTMADFTRPPYFLVKNHIEGCIGTANFARIALEKAGWNVDTYRICRGHIKNANMHGGQQKATYSPLYFITVVEMEDGFYIVGDNKSISTRSHCFLDGPYETMTDLKKRYANSAQWKLVTGHMPNFGHIVKKECKGVSCY